MSQKPKSIHITDTGSMEEARNHKDSDEELFEINSAGELYDLLDRFLNYEITIDFLDFHVHGCPGTVSFPRGSLEISGLKRFRNRNFPKLFVPKAEIKFFSCAAGKGSKGERFLAEVASVFLRLNGGTVQGSDTSLRYHVYQAYFHTNGPPTNPGNWITAEIAPRSTVAKLRNNKWLDLDRIRTSIRVLTGIVQDLQSKLPAPRSYAPVEANSNMPFDQMVHDAYVKQQEANTANEARLWSLYQKLNGQLKKATEFVQAGRPSLDDLNNALDQVSNVTQKLVKENYSVYLLSQVTYEDDKIILDQED